MNENFIITVGRELGSGGRIIAKELAGRLGIAFYDKELIQRASVESGVASQFFEKADEQVNPTVTGALLSSFFQDNYFSNESLFQIQSDAIRKIADTESAVIVGRCADYVLREHPGCVSLFVSARIDDRINAVVIKKRASFYNYYSSKTWGVAKSYDLCINSSVLGIDDTIEFVLKFVKKKLQIE